MKKLALGFVLLLVAAFASAQAVAPGGGGSSSGGGGSGAAGDGGSFVSQTTGDGGWYVSTTGSDSNNCTSSAAPCATLQRVFDLMPYQIWHPQTVNVAGLSDGGVATYTTTASTTFNKSLAASVTLQGPALVNATPATGAATGALTAVNNTAAPFTVTDGSQTWTAGNLATAFIVMTSGAASGQVRAIAKNTSTVLTLAAPFSSTPAASDTYAIQVPGAVVYNNTAGSGVLVMRLASNQSGISPSASLVIDKLDVNAQQVSTPTGLYVGGGSSSLSLTSSRFTSGGAGGNTGMVWNGGGTFATTNAVLYGGKGLAIAANALQRPGGGCRLQLSGALLKASGASTFNSALSFEATVGGCQYSTTTGNYFSTSATDTTSAALTLSDALVGISSTTVPLVLECTANGPAGILSSPTNSVLQGASRVVMGAQVFVLGCNTGVSADDPQTAIYFGGRLDCGGVSGSCINVANGAKVHVPATFNSDAGTDITIDGSAYTKANLTGASPTRLPALAPSLTGSTVWQ